ncbi:MAG: peptide chain release factor N(5)-glutamine methyltransferase, partial [Lysobacterales bacterium]
MSRCRASVAQPIAGLLAAARGRLGNRHADSQDSHDSGNSGAASGLEADLLLAHVLGVSRAWLFANRERAVPAGEAGQFWQLVERRAAGEPIAYLVGRREFWSLPLTVTPDVLIPRPETELLVQAALDFIPADAAWRVADLGTGSGAVALAIAIERPRCEVHATERS